MNETLRQQIQKAIKDVKAMRKTDQVVVACNIKDFAEVQETIQERGVQVIAATYIQKGHIQVEGSNDFWIKKAVRDWEEISEHEVDANADKKDSDHLGNDLDSVRIHPRSITEAGTDAADPGSRA